jgi:hypothetical protein
MLIKLPESVPVPTAMAFGSLMLVAQVAEGTTLILAVLTFAFLMLAVVAFNLAGGMVYPSGSYVATCALLTVLVGAYAKVLLGEPLQRNLILPETTLTVYVTCMASMLAAVYVNTLVRPKRALLQGMTIKSNASGISIGCLVLSIGTPYILPDRLQGTFHQANYFLLLAILIPVFEKVRDTGGRRSFSFPPLLTWVYTTGLGLLSFSKEGIFIGSAAWVIASVTAGYRLSLQKAVVLASIGAAAALILTPYAQVGRNFGRGGGLDRAADVGISLLSHPLELREQYEAQSDEVLDAEGSYHMFDKSQGLLDRLNMFAVDDALIAITEKGQTASPGNLWSYFINLIPSYVYPDKPILAWGNVYAHELNMLGEGDDTTGVSFSPFSDAFHCAQWTGVTIYSFGFFLFCFFVTDAVAGSARESLWALLFVMYNLHGASEGMMGTPAYEATLAIFIIGMAVICSHVVPVISNMVSVTPQQPMQHFDAQGQRTIGVSRI